MDYEALETVINEKTKTIISVDLGGVLCDYGRILSIVKKKEILFRPPNKRKDCNLSGKVV